MVERMTSREDPIPCAKKTGGVRRGNELLDAVTYPDKPLKIRGRYRRQCAQRSARQLRSKIAAKLNA
jgi:hypothetical protein